MNKILSNLKIGKKLSLGFVFVIMLAAILALSNLAAMLKVNHTYVDLQTGANEGNQLSLQMGMEFANARQHLITAALMAYEDREAECSSALKDFDESIGKINQTGDKLKSALKNDANIKDELERTQEMSILQDIMNMISIEYAPFRSTIEAEITEGDSNGDGVLEGLNTAISDADSIAVTINEKLNIVIEKTDLRAREIIDQTSSDMYTTIFWLCIFGAAAIALSVLCAILISRSIRNPVIKLSQAASQIADGNLDIAIRSNAKDEIGDLSNAFGDVIEMFSLLAYYINDSHLKLLNGELEVTIDEQAFPGDFKKAAEAMNSTIAYLEEGTIAAIQCAQAYASGNFETAIKRYTGPQAILSEAFDALQSNLKSISKDLSKLIENASIGKLDAIIDANRYDGDWRKISKGLNSLLESVEIPISEVCHALEEVSVGKFGANIQGDYKGTFALMKNSVNKNIENSKLFIKDITDILVRMSNQDLDIVITKEYVGEYAIIKSALARIIDTFNKIIGEFNNSAEQVASGAAQISESSMALSQGAVEQAAALEETSATVELISRQTSVNAQNSEEVRTLYLEAKDRGIESKSDMNEMLKSMSDIRAASSNISKIIKVIDDIAFQINLLALNAAVEAARAGAHGKGFSVVAEEVRNLAGKSKEAASETADLISHTIEIVTDGTKIANETAGSINTMVEQITNIATLIDGISLASKEQATAILQINEALIQISEVTQANTATAEETASMSQELTSQAEVLRDVLSQIKRR